MWQYWAFSNDCPSTQEDTNFIGNSNPNKSGYHPQQGWNSKPDLPFGQQQGNNFNNSFQPSLKDLVYGKKQINDNISKKFQANDKTMVRNHLLEDRHCLAAIKSVHGDRRSRSTINSHQLGAHVLCDTIKGLLSIHHNRSVITGPSPRCPRAAQPIRQWRPSPRRLRTAWRHRRLPRHSQQPHHHQCPPPQHPWGLQRHQRPAPRCLTMH
jgi:hypothetical protein